MLKRNRLDGFSYINLATLMQFKHCFIPDSARVDSNCDNRKEILENFTENTEFKS